MVKSLAIILGLLIASSVATDAELPDSRIYGGTQASSGEVPYIASIQYESAHICSGIIYNDLFIITTASCVQNINETEAPKIRVVVGELSLISPDNTEQYIPATKKHVFDGYNNVTKLHDIALVELAKAIVFNNNSKVILYEEVDELTGAVNGTISGWGATSQQEDNLVSTRLRVGTVSIFGGNCRDYGSDEYNPNYMLCIGKEGDSASPCKFDEGSPVVQKQNSTGSEKLFVVGIMSKNKGCPAPPENKYLGSSIYTRLAPYYAWLTKIAGQQPSQTEVGTFL